MRAAAVDRNQPGSTSAQRSNSTKQSSTDANQLIDLSVPIVLDLVSTAEKPDVVAMAELGLMPPWSEKRGVHQFCTSIHQAYTRVWVLRLRALEATSNVQPVDELLNGSHTRP